MFLDYKWLQESSQTIVDSISRMSWSGHTIIHNSVTTTPNLQSPILDWNGCTTVPCSWKCDNYEWWYNYASPTM